MSTQSPENPLRPTTIAHHELMRKRWREFTIYQSAYPGLATELEPRPEPISEGALKLFLLYLALGYPERGQQVATWVTMRTYLFTFLACLRRYAGQPTPPALRMQLLAFIASDVILDRKLKFHDTLF